MSGTFETASLIVYGHVVAPEHVSPAMAVALTDNPPGALDGRQIFPELEGNATRLNCIEGAWLAASIVLGS